jgi:DNA-binding FadR family transcriptional regulator
MIVAALLRRDAEAAEAAVRMHLEIVSHSWFLASDAS